MERRRRDQTENHVSNYFRTQTHTYITSRHHIFISVINRSKTTLPFDLCHTSIDGKKEPQGRQEGTKGRPTRSRNWVSEKDPKPEASSMYISPIVDSYWWLEKPSKMPKQASIHVSSWFGEVRFWSRFGISWAPKALDFAGPTTEGNL